MSSGLACYVGVDLDRGRVVSIAADPETVDPDAYVVRGEHSGRCDGVIYLDASDRSDDGRRAREIALAETEPGAIGLGWRFATR
jgi:hypothetical protein